MISFENDYSEGAHYMILKRLIDTDMEQVTGYGEDKFCEEAKAKIREACQCPDADVYFISGGTQTNQIAVSTMIPQWLGVIAPTTGHIEVHESGAVEYTGRKVITLPEYEGKLKPEDIAKYCDAFFADPSHPHMVEPGLVYISHPTELGSLYTKAELVALRETCQKYNLPIYMDGARMGYGLASVDTDVTLADVAELTDAFYIGGTKVGALCGEALVFTKNNTPSHMITQIKQRGALLAKGRLLGVQFATLFTDNLYMKIARHAIDMAEYLKKVLKDNGIKFSYESPTNQQFVILEDSQYEALKEQVVMAYCGKPDETHTEVRFCTSWATKKESIDLLAEILAK